MSETIEQPRPEEPADPDELAPDESAPDDAEEGESVVPPGFEPEAPDDA